MWYHTMIGKKKCPIVDTWWQTETGLHHDFSAAGVTQTTPGSPHAVLRCRAKIVDEKGDEVPRTTAASSSSHSRGPSMLRTLWGDDDRFRRAYFSEFPAAPALLLHGRRRASGQGRLFRLWAASTTCSTSPATAIGTAEWRVRSSRPVGRGSRGRRSPDELKGQALVGLRHRQVPASRRPKR